MMRFRVTLIDDAVLFIAADRTRMESSSVIFEREDDESGRWVTVSDIHRDNIVTFENLTDAPRG